MNTILAKCVIIVRTEAAASLASDHGNYVFCDTRLTAAGWRGPAAVRPSAVLIKYYYVNDLVNLSQHSAVNCCHCWSHQTAQRTSTTSLLITQMAATAEILQRKENSPDFMWQLNLCKNNKLWSKHLRLLWKTKYHLWSLSALCCTNPESLILQQVHF